MSLVTAWLCPSELKIVSQWFCVLLCSLLPLGNFYMPDSLRFVYATVAHLILCC